MTDTSKEAIKTWLAAIVSEESGYEPQLSSFIEALAADLTAATERSEKSEADFKEYAYQTRKLDEEMADVLRCAPDDTHIAARAWVERAEKAEAKNEAYLEEISRAIWDGYTGSVEEIVEAIKKISTTTEQIPRLRVRVSALEGALRDVIGVHGYDGPNTEAVLERAQSVVYAALSATPAPAVSNKEGE